MPGLVPDLVPDLMPGSLAGSLSGSRPGTDNPSGPRTGRSVLAETSPE